MGLREKVALIWIVIFQITNIFCMPRYSRSCTLKDYFKGPDKRPSDSLRPSNYKQSCRNDGNSQMNSVLEGFDFQNVEYPTFQYSKNPFNLINNINYDQTLEAKAYDVSPGLQALINNRKKEARMKRKKGAIKHLTKENIGQSKQLPGHTDFILSPKTNIVDLISSFPEVEYPITASDVWSSKYQNSMSSFLNSAHQLPNDKINLGGNLKSNRSYTRQPDQDTVSRKVKKRGHNAFSKPKRQRNDKMKQTERQTDPSNMETCNSKNNSTSKVFNETMIFNKTSDLTSSLADMTNTLSNLDLNQYNEILSLNNSPETNRHNETDNALNTTLTEEIFGNNSLSKDNIDLSCYCSKDMAEDDNSFLKNNTTSLSEDKLILFIDDLIREAIKSISFEDGQPLMDRSTTNKTIQKIQTANPDTHTYVEENKTHEINNTSCSYIEQNKIENCAENALKNIEESSSSFSDIPFKISLLTPNFLEAICDLPDATNNKNNFEENILVEIVEKPYRYEKELSEPVLLCYIDANNETNNNATNICDIAERECEKNSNSFLYPTSVPKLAAIAPYTESCNSELEKQIHCHYNYIEKQTIDAPNLKTLIIKNPLIYNIEKKKYSPHVTFNLSDNNTNIQQNEKNNKDTNIQLDLITNIAELCLLKENHFFESYLETETKKRVQNLTKETLNPTQCDDEQLQAIELLISLGNSNSNYNEPITPSKENVSQNDCETIFKLLEGNVRNRIPVIETHNLLSGQLNCDNIDLVRNYSLHDFDASEDGILRNIKGTSDPLNDENVVTNCSLVELIIDILLEDCDSNIPIELLIKPYVSDTGPYNSSNLASLNLSIKDTSITFKPTPAHAFDNNVTSIHQSNDTNQINKYNQEDNGTSIITNEKNKNMLVSDPISDKVGENDISSGISGTKPSDKVINDGSKPTNPTQSSLCYPHADNNTININVEKLTLNSSLEEPASRNKFNEDSQLEYHPNDGRYQKIPPVVSPHTPSITKGNKTLTAATPIPKNVNNDSNPQKPNKHSSLQNSNSFIPKNLSKPETITNENNKNLLLGNTITKSSLSSKTPNDFEFDPKADKKIDIHDKSNKITKNNMNNFKEFVILDHDDKHKSQSDVIVPHTVKSTKVTSLTATSISNEAKDSRNDPLKTKKADILYPPHRHFLAPENVRKQERTNEITEKVPTNVLLKKPVSDDKKSNDFELKQIENNFRKTSRIHNYPNKFVNQQTKDFDPQSNTTITQKNEHIDSITFIEHEDNKNRQLKKNDQLSSKQIITIYRDHFRNGSMPSNTHETPSKNRSPSEQNDLNINDATQASNKSQVKRITPKQVIKQYRDYFRNQSDVKINETKSKDAKLSPINMTKDNQNEVQINEIFSNAPTDPKRIQYITDSNKRNVENVEYENTKNIYHNPNYDEMFIIDANIEDYIQDEGQSYDISVTDMPYDLNDAFPKQNDIEIEIINTITTIFEPDESNNYLDWNREYLIPHYSYDLTDKQWHDITTFNYLNRGTETSNKEYTLEDDMLLLTETKK